MSGTQNLRISMVGYLNTLPFVTGLRKDGYDPILDVPARCLDYFISGEADIALVPVGALVDIEDNEYEIITDYCIGCDGEVRTVCLFSDNEIRDIHTVVLDSDSRTSVMLVRRLLKEYWHISPEIVSKRVERTAGVAHLMIGDKVFAEEAKYAYKYDLGQIWKEHTGMPFVFAVWIAKKGVSVDDLTRFNTSLSRGLDTIGSVSYPTIPNVDLDEYFTKYIKYTFGESQRKAVERFLGYLKSTV